MKTVEGLLEKGLIEVANKEEELKVSGFSKIDGQNNLSDILLLAVKPQSFINEP